MALFSSLGNVSSDNYHIDASTILSDLDRGLRSSSIGDQCEAIVRFPWLFHRYPFPVLINSAALKLSEVYRNGSNFIRILILQVMKESEKHLDKILNIDEFVRHLFAVSYANDPLARSITLRTLGHIARIVSNNKNIHHFIRNSLNSNDELEVDAAIEASVRFAIHSQDFAENIYPKVISMIEGLTTPIGTKIKLLEVINNIHHNFAIAEDARKKLISFLGKYPGRAFVCEDLHTLTSIAASSVTYISKQVKLLLEYYLNDPRSSVKLSVLGDLKLLARESAHLWEKGSISAFVDIAFANISQNPSFLSQIILEINAIEIKLLCEALSVLSELLGSPSVFIDESLFCAASLSKVIEFSTQIIHQSAMQNLPETDEVQILIVAECFTILTNICIHADEYFINTSSVLEETCAAYEAFFLSKSNSSLSCTESREALSSILHCLVKLCKTRESYSAQVLQITESLRYVFLKTKPDETWFEMICETICSLSFIIWHNKSITATDLMELIRSRFGHYKKRPKREHGPMLVKLFIMLFQLKVGSYITDQETRSLLSIFNSCNLWLCYKIVREAMRFSQHNFASQLLCLIKSSMEPIENTYFWVNSLTKISQAESYLRERNKSAAMCEHSFNEKLSQAVSTYTEGFTHLKASVSSQNPMRFQCEFIKLRMKYLQAHQHFRQCCKLLQSSPPPSQSMPLSGGMPEELLLRCGRIASSMRKCAQEFRTLGESYSALHQSSFNADHNSLANIQLLQHSCTIVVELIENLFEGSHRINALLVPARVSPANDNKELQQPSNVKQQQPSQQSKDDKLKVVKKQNSIIEHKELEDVHSFISSLVRTNQLLSLSSLEKSSDVLTVFTRQVQMLLHISTQILAASLPFPRYFFQSTQSVSIKLELSPQPRANHDYILINQTVQFVLNVEGVVSNQRSNATAEQHLSIVNPAKPANALNAVGYYAALPATTDTDCKAIRKVNKILLTLNAVALPSNSPNDINLHNCPTVLSMHSMVVPLNDYFRSQFLLNFKNVGFYNIIVEACIIDENEAQWKTGPVHSVVAKVIEDKNL